MPAGLCQGKSGIWSTARMIIHMPTAPATSGTPQAPRPTMRSRYWTQASVSLPRGAAEKTEQREDGDGDQDEAEQLRSQQQIGSAFEWARLLFLVSASCVSVAAIVACVPTSSERAFFSIAFTAGSRRKRDCVHHSMS